VVSVSTPYQFIGRGNLFIVPVGPAIADAPYPTQSFTRAPDYSLWVGGQVREPGPDLDRARMSPRLYQEVRDDLVRYSPVEVTRSAIRRSEHAYVGVIDSRGMPYYFALDSRGVSVREAPADAAWKAFDALSDREHRAAVDERRAEAAAEVDRVGREVSGPALVVSKGLRYGKKTEWKRDVPHSTWWRNPPKEKRTKEPKDEKPSAAGSDDAGKSDRARFGNWYAAEYRRAGHELWLQLDDGEGELDPLRPGDALWLALPRGGSKDDGVKKTPSRKASRKQAGATGRVRYTYPQEGKGGGSAGRQVPLVVTHDDTRHADPAELANQLGVSVRTLQRCARRLGSDGFPSYMRSRLRRFAAKHRLDPDYWGTLYARLVAGDDGVAKSDAEAALKQFGSNVKKVASATPPGHKERVGDRKVFIHHVHHEMKRHGLYSGTLDEFKDHVVRAHQKGHLVAARADLVAAMDPHSVKQSETDPKHGATFHFINNAAHDPSASRELESKRGPEAPKPQATRRQASSKRVTVGAGHDEANRMTDAAIAASEHARKTGTLEDHLAAMTAHHHAGAAHQKATGRVNSKVALAHFDQSAIHLKAAKGGG
jgi:hypothetical protein